MKMNSSTALWIAIGVLTTMASVTNCMFSVYQDIYARPAFVIKNQSTTGPGGAYLRESEVQAYIASVQQHGAHYGSGPGVASAAAEIEIMKHKNQTYVCAIPVVQDRDWRPVLAEWGPGELERAKSAGVELLAPLGRMCLYYVKDWWTYSFCYGREVRQYHEDKPMIRGASVPPPKPEDVVMNFVLGQFDGAGGAGAESGGTSAVVAASKRPENQQSGSGSEDGKIEIKAVGEAHSLTYQLGKGTVCEVTGEARTIEVRFFCNPGLPRRQDRIALVKEVKSCHYLIEIETVRLCKDVVFVPPKKKESYSIDCRLVVREGDEDVAPLLDNDPSDSSKKSAAANPFLTVAGGGALFTLDLPEDNRKESGIANKASFTENMDKTLSLVLDEVSRMITAGELKGSDGRAVRATDEFSTVLSLVDLDGKLIINVKIELSNGQVEVAVVSQEEMDGKVLGTESRHELLQPLDQLQDQQHALVGDETVDEGLLQRDEL